MIPHLFYDQRVILVLVWLCVMLPHLWPTPSRGLPKRPADPIKPKRNRSSEPKPFAGLTHKPHCALGEQEPVESAPAPPVRPAPMPPTNRRPREVDTSRPCCPHRHGDYGGWLGLNNLRAHGHPRGGPWRQFHCLGCDGDFLETHGTIFHGKQAAVELIVRVLACLAEGLGIRATARGFEVDPNTGLGGVVEAAEQLKAFAHYFLCEVHVQQVQLDALYAVLSAVREGQMSAEEAIQRLSRSPHWVWTAIDPQSKLLLASAVGPRPQAMAQRIVHQVVQVLAPGCVPLFLTDGFTEYATALRTHFGQWVQPSRRQDKGPPPKPRWRPLPQLLYAQVVKTVRRRRLVDVSHRVVVGTLEAVEQVFATGGWRSNTSFVERLNLDIRQHVAAVGRRVATLCKGEEGVRQQLALYHVYDNFCLPHASVRQPLPQPEPTTGTGSATRWQPRTPAMAAGLPEHVWTLREVLLYRVPPWPQPAGV
jgi:IS1 family transposase